MSGELFKLFVSSAGWLATPFDERPSSSALVQVGMAAMRKCGAEECAVDADAEFEAINPNHWTTATTINSKPRQDCGISEYGMLNCGADLFPNETNNK